MKKMPKAEHLDDVLDVRKKTFAQLRAAPRQVSMIEGPEYRTQRSAALNCAPSNGSASVSAASAMEVSKSCASVAEMGRTARGK